MYSKYFDIDIPIPEQTMMSGGEEVRIIPHAILEDILYNSESAISRNVVIHYTPITTNEARHYACLCAISDKFGRRVESVGESLDGTLDTDIARNYPTLMAYKRAFDDAAIKYLGLDGKVYSDQQIAVSGSESKPSSVTAPGFAGDETGGEEFTDNNGFADSETKPTDAVTTDSRDWPPSDDFSNAFDPHANAKNSDTAPVPRTNGKQRRFGRNPNAPAPSDTPADSPAPTPAATPTKGRTRGRKLGQPAATPATNTEHDTEVQDGRDEFDELLECSRVKEPMSIRETYAKDPDIIHWCATQMRIYSSVDEVTKARCQRFLELVEGGRQ